MTNEYRNIEYRQNASALHKKIGNVLKNSSIFSGYKIYQEYPVNKVNPRYRNNRHKFDWVITDLYLVIEAHGQQHYKEISFSKETIEERKDHFLDQKLRDNQKMNAAIDAGYTYVIIPFSDYERITDNYIFELYKTHMNNKVVIKVNNEQNIRQREYRYNTYQRRKAYLNKYLDKEDDD